MRQLPPPVLSWFLPGLSSRMVTATTPTARSPISILRRGGQLFEKRDRDALVQRRLRELEFQFRCSSLGRPQHGLFAVAAPSTLTCILDNRVFISHGFSSLKQDDRGGLDEHTMTLRNVPSHEAGHGVAVVWAWRTAEWLRPARRHRS